MNWSRIKNSVYMKAQTTINLVSSFQTETPDWIVCFCTIGLITLWWMLAFDFYLRRYTIRSTPSTRSYEKLMPRSPWVLIAFAGLLSSKPSIVSLKYRLNTAKRRIYVSRAYFTPDTIWYYSHFVELNY